MASEFNSSGKTNGGGKRFRSTRACTSCRQMKMKCDRREKLPDRCTRCQETDSVCEISSTFKRQRMKGNIDNEETRALRQELEQLKSQVASLAPQASSVDTPSTTLNKPSPVTVTWAPNFGLGAHPTIQRSAGDITLLSWHIDAAFATFFEKMHPLLPFVTESPPNACYNREPFLFWTICTLGLRSVAPDLAHALSPFVSAEALDAPRRSCHNQAAATAVIQALLLLSLWPFKSPSLLHETVWLHCGSATHLARHIGLHHPHSASEFTPKERRAHIPALVTEFRRTWIACYIMDSLVSFARGYPSTIRADFNLIEYTESSAAQLSISPDLFKFLLIARRIEEGQDLGSPHTVQYGHLDPPTRGPIYDLLQSRVRKVETRITPLSPYMDLFLMATKLLPALQVLQSTSPIALQETTILSAFGYANQLINDARLVQSTTDMVHLPVFVDGLVLISALLVFKIQISVFSHLVDSQQAQNLISEACTYYRNGINDFSTIPARLTIFMDGLHAMVSENQLPVGGFIIENAKCHNSQNILYEVRGTNS